MMTLSVVWFNTVNADCRYSQTKVSFDRSEFKFKQHNMRNEKMNSPNLETNRVFVPVGV